MERDSDTARVNLTENHVQLVSLKRRHTSRDVLWCQVPINHPDPQARQLAAHLFNRRPEIAEHRYVFAFIHQIFYAVNYRRDFQQLHFLPGASITILKSAQ